MDNNYNIKAVERALILLKCFSPVHDEWGLQELATQMGLNKSSVFRLASTLEDYDFLKLEENGKYRLGNTIYQLSTIHSLYKELRSAAIPYMKELEKLTGETVLLTKYDDCRSICIGKVESQNMLKITSQEGADVCMMRGATGKVILAFLPGKELDRCITIQQTINETKYNRIELSQEFEIIRKNGYCISSSELDLGVTALSVPLFNYTGKVVGSISIAGPSFRFVPENTPQYIQNIVESGEQISKKMGYILVV